VEAKTTVEKDPKTTIRGPGVQIHKAEEAVSDLKDIRQGRCLRRAEKDMLAQMNMNWMSRSATPTTKAVVLVNHKK